MTRLNSHAFASAADDSLLGQLADRYADALARGEELSLEQLAREYPEHADLIREMFPAIVALQRLGQPRDSGFPGEDLGDFHLLREVGRGGMGIVYEAEQISLARRVALKILPSTAVLEPKQLARFRVEAQAAASLEHPHIVSVYAVGSDRGVQFYAMRYIEGQSLAEVIAAMRQERGASDEERENAKGRASRVEGQASSPPLKGGARGGILATDHGQRTTDNTLNTAPVAHAPTTPNASLLAPRSSLLVPAFNSREYFGAVAQLGIQAAEALHYAHEVGIVHRDIKPSNLLIDCNGRLFVTDFGLALIQGSAELTLTGDLIGTLRYMSPEQANGQRALIDRRTDVYGLGASLYELATLQPAFPEQDRALLLRQIVDDNPPRPSQIARNIPRDLETILLKALAKEPTNRYDTAKELADDLGRFVRNEPIQARPITRFESVRSWCRRNKLVASLLVTVATLLLILAVGGPLVAVKQTQLVREARRELNAKKINQLYQDWYSGNVQRVGEELQRHFSTAGQAEPFFEWELLRRMYEDGRKNILFERRNEPKLPKFVEFSPDGHWLAAGQPGDRLGLYDIEHKKWRQLDNDPAGGAAAIAFTRDGRQLATVSWLGVVNRREVDTGRVVGPVIDCGAGEEKKGDLFSWNGAFQLSPDGRTAAVGMQTGSLALVRFADGACEKTAAHKGCVNAVAFSPDGSKLFSAADDKLLKTWDLQDDRLRPDATASLSTAAKRILFTPEKDRIMACGWAGVHILDASTLAEIFTLPTSVRAVVCVALNSNGKLAAADRNGQITIWDLETRRQLAALDGHEAVVRYMAFSPDGDTLASYSRDGSLRLWPIGQKIRAATDRVRSAQRWRPELQFIEHGQKLLSCTRPFNAAPGDTATTFVTQWDVAKGLEATVAEQNTYGRCDLAILPDSDLLLCGGPGRLTLHRVRSGELVRHLDVNPLHEYHHVAVSPDGQWAVGVGQILDRPRKTDYFTVPTVATTCFVSVYSLKSGQRTFFSLPLRTDLNDGWTIDTVAFAPDSQLLITGGGDGEVLYRLDVFARTGDTFTHQKSDEILSGGEIGAVRDIAFSANGRLVGVVTETGYGRMWSLGDDGFNKSIRRQGGLLAMAFSPDGRVLALGDRAGIQLCDLQTMFPLATIPIGSGVCDLQFSPDGRTLAWASFNGQVEFLRTQSVVMPSPTTDSVTTNIHY